MQCIDIHMYMYYDINRCFLRGLPYTSKIKGDIFRLALSWLMEEDLGWWWSWGGRLGLGTFFHYSHGLVKNLKDFLWDLLSPVISGTDPPHVAATSDPLCDTYFLGFILYHVRDISDER